MTKWFIELEKGNLIKYNFLYSNEIEKIGIVYDIKEDLNFSAIIFISGEKNDSIPYSIMEYKILDKKH